MGFNLTFSSEVALRLFAGAYIEAEVSLQIGYFLVFQSYQVQERMSLHPNQNIMTLSFIFAPAIQNSLTWATLYFAVLHHCISSVLSCNQNTHGAQGPKSDYTHAYNHSLSNLLSFQLPFWRSSVFSMLHFLSFIPIQSPLAN